MLQCRILRGRCVLVKHHSELAYSIQLELVGEGVYFVFPLSTSTIRTCTKLLLNKLCTYNIYWPILLDPTFFWDLILFWTQNIYWPKIVLDPKVFWSQIYFGQKSFLSQISYTVDYFDPFYLTHNYFDIKSFRPKIIVTKFIFGPKTKLYPKIFGAGIFVGPIFLLILNF